VQIIANYTQHVYGDFLSSWVDTVNSRCCIKTMTSNEELFNNSPCGLYNTAVDNNVVGTTS